MPEVNGFYDPTMLSMTDDEWVHFLDTVQRVTAEEMDAIDPKTGTMFVNDPFKHIDVVFLEAPPRTSRITAVVLVKIITYAWEDRMSTIDERIGKIADVIDELVRGVCVPGDRDAVSVTFLSKDDKCWVYR